MMCHQSLMSIMYASVQVIIASLLTEVLGTLGGTVRASIGIYNDEKDIDALVEATKSRKFLWRIFIMKIEDLYRDIIMEHYKNPRNKGLLNNENIKS